MGSPIVNVVSVSRDKISDEIGMNKTLVTIEFDQDVQGYTVNVNGVSFSTGKVIEYVTKYIRDYASVSVASLSNSKVSDMRRFAQGQRVEIEVDNTELYEEGNNRVNLYGQAIDGSWTQYDQS